MSKKLGVTLRRFAAGRDGGIDLTDNPAKKQIIVQAKHYNKTSISGLVSSLKKELPKVKKLSPTQYYICCSKELSAIKISEIYSIFSDYMSSPANVVTLIEIENFLVDPKNIDILRKHYKLWISSTTVLQDIYSNDIFIDCEALLSNIDVDEKFFVQTEAYDHALECLSKSKSLFITGDPGVGKTITSKMLILHFAANGYRVRYTTDGSDLSALKKSLSQDPDVKEIILLDDCFGQAYFSMKDTQGNELLSLIKYVNISPNKRLILNSRVTIYREAQVRTPELVKSLENKEYKVYIIDMSAMSDIEKAKILYNHLYFNDIPEEYFLSLKHSKNYRRIVNHPNYNPRIIEFVCNPYRYSSIEPSFYNEFVLNYLDNPDKVWDDEYERKLTNTDRILLTTLYSLTDTTCPIDFVEMCFNARIRKFPTIDLTVNQFSNSLSRLQQAFIKVVDEKGYRSMSMANPSVNDYIRSRVTKSTIERDGLVQGAASIRQLKRILAEDDYISYLAAIFSDGSILNYLFESEGQKNAYITYYISHNHVLDLRYQTQIHSYLKNMKSVSIYESQNISPIHLLLSIVEGDVLTFYKIDSLLANLDLLEKILSNFEIGDLVDAVIKFYDLYKDLEGFLFLSKTLLKEAIIAHCEYVDADEFDIDVNQYIRDSCRAVHWGDDEYYEEPDMDDAAKSIEQHIQELVKDEILDCLKVLPTELSLPTTFIDKLYIGVSGSEDLVKSQLQSDYDDDRYDGPPPTDYNEIDLIFNR